MPGDTEELLEECLGALQRGDTIEQCLARYPDRAEELEPLLRIAQAVMVSPLGDPNPELKAETLRSLRISSQDSPTEAEIQEALNHCIDLLAEGYDPDKCLELYPRSANVLRPLVEVAVAIRRAFALEPDPSFKKETRQRVLAASRQRRGKNWLSWGIWPKWAYRGAFALACVLVVFLIGAGTVRASSGSVPGDLLYPVKELSEKVQLKLATSEESEARVHVKLADRRAEEMAEMARQGNYEEFENLMAKVEEHLSQVSLLIEEKHKEDALKLVFQKKGDESAQGLELDGVRKLLDTLDEDIKTNVARFKETLVIAPADMKAEMELALLAIKDSYSDTIQALEGRYSTSELVQGYGTELVFLRP